MNNLNGFTIFMLAVVVVGIPVTLGVGSEIFKTWLKHRERMAEKINAQAAERAAQYAAQTERLEQRMRVLERIAAREAGWLHDDPAHSDCERLNADAHLRAMFLGHGVTLQVSGGELVLGQWQRVLFAELDGPRPRTLRLLAMGGA